MSTSARFERDALTILVHRSGIEAAMLWVGESDSRNPSEFLNPIIKQQVSELAGLPVTVDLTGLTYMNSATVAPLISCIKLFDASASAVHVLFSDADWQRTHVQCLRAISRTLKRVRIDVQAAGGNASNE